MDLKKIIRDIPDFPKKGIMFRDITTILKDPLYFNEALTQMEAQVADLDFDLIVSAESRGFIFGAPMAVRLNKGLILARKVGKLPAATISKSYSLEYGEDSIEIHKDAIKPGQKIILVDDLLATGGTAKCICDIVTDMGGQIMCNLFLIELTALGGREILKDYNVKTVLEY